MFELSSRQRRLYPTWAGACTGVWVGALVIGLTLGGPAAALDQLKIIAPANPGGGWDQTARALQSVIQKEHIVGNVTVENVGGAGGTIGLAQFVSKEKGKGTAILVNGLVMVGAILTNGAPVTLDQVTPLARLTGEYELLAVPKDSPIATLADLITKLKADPGSVAWGGGSAGGTDHILAGLIANASGVKGADLNYVPYSGGGETLSAILGGHVTVGVAGFSEWESQIKTGELRALAISAPTRVAGIDVPTLKEQGVDVELANWRAVMAPPGLDAAEMKALSETVDKAVKSVAWAEILKQRNWQNLYLPAAEFAPYLAEENVKVTATLKSIGLVQ